jgi:hypothetical protein
MGKQEFAGFPIGDAGTVWERTIDCLDRAFCPLAGSWTIQRISEHHLYESMQ